MSTADLAGYRAASGLNGQVISFHAEMPRALPVYRPGAAIRRNLHQVIALVSTLGKELVEEAVAAGWRRRSRWPAL